MITLQKENTLVNEVVSAYDKGWEESNIVVRVDGKRRINMVNFPVYAKKKKDQKPGKVVSFDVSSEELNILKNHNSLIGEHIRSGKIRFC